MVDHHEGQQDQEKTAALNIYETEHNSNSFECQDEYAKGAIPIRPGHLSFGSSDTAKSFTNTPTDSSPSLVITVFFPILSRVIMFELTDFTWPNV